MAKIFKRTDRIPVRINEVVVHIAPLSIDQKVEIQDAAIKGRAKGDIKELTRSVTLAMKYAIKKIEGIEDSDGKPYQLQFDGENLSDECLVDLMNLEITDKLSSVCVKFMQGIPSEFTDASGNKLEGVEFVKPLENATEKN